MYIETIWQWMGWGLMSFLSFGVMLFIPGRAILGLFSKRKNISLSVVVGMAFLAIQAYITGYLKIRWFGYFYTILALIWGFKNRIKIWKEIKEEIAEKKKDSWLGVIIILGLVISLSGVFFNAWPDKSGIWIYDINRIDGSYHLALINSLLKNVPPIEPGMPGALVTNYHYWSDLVLAEIVRVFGIPSFNLFYQYFPLLLAVTMGLIAYDLGKSLRNQKIGKWLAFLMYNGGNWGWLVILILKKYLTLDMASLDNGAIVFTNPPRAMAQVIFLGGCILIYDWLKKKDIKSGVLAGILLASTVAFKVYVGIFGAVGLTTLGIYFGVKKQYKMWWPIIISGGLSMLFFFPTNHNTGGFVWEPFAWPRHYFAQNEAMVLEWHLQEQVFEHYKNNLRLIILHWQMLVYFLLILFGSRSLGIFGIKKSLKDNGVAWTLFLGVPIIGAIFIGCFFIQESGALELFNFLAAAGVGLSIFLAKFMGDRKNVILIILVIVLTIPKPVNQAFKYYKQYKNKTEESALLYTKTELELLKKIDENKIVMTNRDDKWGQFSPYVTAITRAKTYMGGVGILKAHGLDVAKKASEVNGWWKETSEVFCQKLTEAKIDYLYLRDGTDPVGIKGTCLKLIGESEGKRLYKVK